MSTLSDARVVRTREALREAMMALAAERPIEAITVRAIAARAGVGYATFFRHYSDKEALLAHVAERLIQDFLRQARPLMEQRDRPAAARSLCQFVSERLPLYKALLAGGSGETVRAEMVRQSMATLAHARKHPAEGPLDDLLLFHFVSATLNMLAWWMRHLDEVDTDTMAEMIERAVLTPVSALRARPAGTP
jgi:AcrR family transcriptional regulator